MAAGCAVIVIDGRGLAGLVTHDNVASWRENNFGLRVLSRRFSAESLVEEIDRYDPNDARVVCDFIRAHSPLDDHVDRLEQIHREVIAEARATPIDNRSLPQSMARAFRALAEARQRQTEEDFWNLAIAREKALADEFQARLTSEVLTLQHSLRAKEVEFQAYRDWAAPRNLGRRIAHKLRRMLPRRTTRN